MTQLPWQTCLCFRLVSILNTVYILYLRHTRTTAPAAMQARRYTKTATTTTSSIYYYYLSYFRCEQVKRRMHLLPVIAQKRFRLTLNCACNGVGPYACHNSFAGNYLCTRNVGVFRERDAIVIADTFRQRSLSILAVGICHRPLQSAEPIPCPCTTSQTLCRSAEGWRELQRETLIGSARGGARTRTTKVKLELCAWCTGLFLVRACRGQLVVVVCSNAMR